MKLYLTNAIIWFICALCFLVPIIISLATGTFVFDIVTILRIVTAVLSLVNATIHAIKYFKTKQK